MSLDYNVYKKECEELNRRVKEFNATHSEEERIENVNDNNFFAVRLLLDMCGIDDELEEIDGKEDEAAVAKRNRLNDDMKEILFENLGVVFDALYDYIKQEDI